MGTEGTIRRALRLIEEGALDETGISHLAERLGMGERHLRRLFQKHVGASPLSLARTRRAHFARRLIEESSLPLATIALSSGFGSIRTFNAAMREAFGAPPNHFRRGIEANADERPLRLRLPFKPPLNWAGMLQFLRPRLVPGVEVIGEDRYQRTISVADWTGTLAVRAALDEPCLWLELPVPPPRALMPIVARVSRMFDLGADLGQIEEQLAADAELAALIGRRAGLRVPGCWDPFELGVRAILGQQVFVGAASTLTGRLVDLLGTPLQLKSPGLRAIFPSPQTVASADLSNLGIPLKRCEAIRAFASAVRDGLIRLDGARPASEVTAALQELPGVGSWTAEYIALRGLHEPDAFPASDLGIRRRLSRGGPVDLTHVLRRAEAWRPWRAYAAIPLWMDGPEPESE